MSNAREQLIMRNKLQLWLDPHELRAINWQPLMNASSEAITRGWTGEELARWCIADLGRHTENVPAAILTTIRALAQQDPPRDTTPTPEPYDDTERQQRIANAATPEQRAHWIAAIRRTIADHG